jgi:K+-sensing histidine kinase KdpD
MEDLSLHIMDIVENSLRAGADHIDILLSEDSTDNMLVLEIEDNGKGMEHEKIKEADNPFFTTKDKKKFGLGLSLLSQACEEAGGHMKVERGSIGGLKVTASFYKNHVDMKPMGNIDRTLKVLRAANPDVQLSYIHILQEARGDTTNHKRR